MEVEVRKINETEGSLLKSVRLSSLRYSPWAFGACLSNEEKKPLSEYEVDAKRHAYSDTSTTFLALKNNDVVGQIGAFFKDGKAYICAMWVAPCERGSKIANKARNKCPQKDPIWASLTLGRCWWSEASHVVK